MQYRHETIFGEVCITELTGKRHSCRFIQTVHNGERKLCGNTAKFKIERNDKTTDFRCGLHMADYNEVLKNGD